MAIYLDQKRRCDNCHKELGTALAIPCKGETAYMCQKTEMCVGCAGKHQGWCQDCFEAECFWIYGDDGEDEVTEIIIFEELAIHAHAQEQQKLEQWNKLAQA